MDVVGRDQARRGQLVAKPVTQSVRHRHREHDQHREKDREILARVKEFVGKNDKLFWRSVSRTLTPMLTWTWTLSQASLRSLIRSSKPRRVSRRVPRRESLRESLRAWLRAQVCLRESLRGLIRVWIRACPLAERKRWAMALGNQLRVDNRDCKRTRVQIAHNSVARNKSNASADSEVFHAPRTVATDAALLEIPFVICSLTVRLGCGPLAVVCVVAIPATVLCVLSRSRRLSFPRACVVWPHWFSSKVFWLVMEVISFRHRRRSHGCRARSGPKVFWQKQSHLSGRQEWTCKFCSESNVWTRWRCRRCYHNIPTGLHGKYRQAVAAKSGEWSTGSSGSSGEENRRARSSEAENKELRARIDAMGKNEGVYNGPGHPL